MKEKKVASLKIVFEDGSDYSVACEVGLDRDELVGYIMRAFKPEPAEPLIKDEKVRKAVRAWAEINGIDKVKYVAYGSNEYTLIYEKIDVNLWIQFERSIVEFGKLVDYQFYTIAELCGEEEE